MTADDTTSTSDTSTLTEGTATTDAMTDSQSGTVGDATDTASDAWCRDADGDGFGDPDECESAEVKPLGSVDNDDDCDDGDVFAFPGAAPEEPDPGACMRDFDGDDWGDANAVPSVTDGTDCDDADASTFPGAAPNDDPGACMRDADGDGWGDADGNGVGEGGSDCNDDDEDLNPDMLGLTTFSGSRLYGIDRTVPLTSAWDRELQTAGGAPIDVDVQSAALTDVLGAPGAFAYGTTPGGLHTVAYDYANCDIPALVNPVETPMMEYTADTVCGIERGPDGALYAVDEDGGVLVELDEITGTAVRVLSILDPSGTPITITDCGLAFDCGHGRLLLANAMDRTIYALVPDPPGAGSNNATATPLRDLDSTGTWTAVGLEWDPVARMAILSTGTALREVDVDNNDAAPTTLGSLQIDGDPLSITNLQFLPNSCQR